MNMQTSRRALLGSMALAPIAGAAVATGAPVSSDIEQHWQARCAAYRHFDADKRTFDNADLESDYWDRIDHAEIGILQHPDTSPRAAELRLWVAWAHCDATNQMAINLGDVATLKAKRASLDWHEKMIFAAILNLRGEA